jgi:ComF family protein
VPTTESTTCKACRQASGLQQIWVAAAYKDLAKQLVWRLKFDGAQAAVATMADQMLPLLSQETNAWLVPVPTASTRARNRGYDQAKLLAKQFSRRSHLPYADCLRRRGQTHQVGSSRQQRLEQLHGAFSVKQRAFPAGAKVILVDDIVTTGATLEAAASVLKQAGATEISAIAFAQP